MSGGGHEGSGFVPRRFVLAEFPSPEALLEGTTRVRTAGYKSVDTHSPYPIHGLEEALGIKWVNIPLLVLLGAIAGATIAYSMIYFMNVYDWPINIANRPAHSPPASIPITFELAVLLAGSSAFFGFFTLARLPRPYHPVFESENFLRCSVDAFFLSVEIAPGGDADKAAEAMRAAGGFNVEIVQESER